jgi:hypothetical protein
VGNATADGSHAYAYGAEDRIILVNNGARTYIRRRGKARPEEQRRQSLEKLPPYEQRAFLTTDKVIATAQDR